MYNMRQLPDFHPFSEKSTLYSTTDLETPRGSIFKAIVAIDSAHSPLSANQIATTTVLERLYPKHANASGLITIRSLL